MHPTQTATDPHAASHQPVPDAETGPTIPGQPSDVLLEFVLGFLTPLLMAGCTSDLVSARLAAIETLAAYRVRTQAELIKVAQIVAYGLAAMDNLRLSMAPDLPVSLKLRLRSGANALNRSAQQITRGLEQSRRQQPSSQRQAVAPWAVQGRPELVDRDAIEPGAQTADAQVTSAPVTSAQVTSAQVTSPATGQDDMAAVTTLQDPAASGPAMADAARHMVAHKIARQAAVDPAASSAANRHERTINLMWASAMTDVAHELRHDLGTRTSVWQPLEAMPAHGAT